MRYYGNILHQSDDNLSCKDKKFKKQLTVTFSCNMFQMIYCTVVITHIHSASTLLGMPAQTNAIKNTQPLHLFDTQSCMFSAEVALRLS